MNTSSEVIKQANQKYRNYISNKISNNYFCQNY